VPGKKSATNSSLPLLLQMLADYMSHLKNMALNDAFKKYGTFDDSLIQWILGVPASWTHEQRSLMRQACFEAGIVHIASSDTLILLMEPEAALIGLQESGELDLNVGEFVTVLDCGGDRTTVSTFKILPGPAYMPQGKVKVIDVGSETIDEELFGRFLAHVGAGVFEEWVQQVPQLVSRILSQFKVLKQYFSLRKQNDSHKMIRILNVC
jgi:molecular chaperone DnaK (HSP70)